MRPDRRLLLHCLAAAALFTLPACSFQPHAVPTFNAGPTPQSSVIFCDIEKIGSGRDHTSRVCFDAASPAVQTMATSLTSAAVTFANGATSSPFALDKSADAVSHCGPDGEIIEFEGPFPQGTPQCLNCAATIGTVYADANAACVSLCDSAETVPGINLGLSDAQISAYCSAHAHASTNVPLTGCPMGFEGACAAAGTLSTTFTDPRIFPEPVMWTDLINAAAGGTGNNDLSQTAASSPDGSFIAGAASSQWVGHGDAFVEFAPAETNKTHVIGFSQLAMGATPPDNDTDPTTADINFAFDLGNDGRVYILQSGTVVTGPGIGGSWDNYAAGDRFRLEMQDLGGGIFNLTFSKIVGTCTAGTTCNETHYTTMTSNAGGPFRVDAAFHDQGAALQNVVLMRIIAQ